MCTHRIPTSQENPDSLDQFIVRSIYLVHLADIFCLHAFVSPTKNICSSCTSATYRDKWKEKREWIVWRCVCLVRTDTLGSWTRVRLFQLLCQCMPLARGGGGGCGAVADPGRVLWWLQHPVYLKILNLSPVQHPRLNRSWIRLCRGVWLYT